MPRRTTPDPYALAIGQRIQKLYKAKRLTMEQFATLAVTSKGHMCNLVRGLVVPTVATLRKIAAALNVHPGALLPEDGARDQVVEESPRRRPARGRVVRKIEPT